MILDTVPSPPARRAPSVGVAASRGHRPCARHVRIVPRHPGSQRLRRFPPSTAGPRSPVTAGNPAVSRSSIAAARAVSLELKNMNQSVKQAEANHMQVVIEQLMTEAVKQAEEWNALSLKARIEAWGEWAETKPEDRRLLRFDRIIQAVEEVH